MMKVEKSDQACGALVHGLDLSKPLSAAQHQALRNAWLDNQVIGITGQSLDIKQLERFATGVGPFGDDPFIAAMPGHPHVIEVKREADEKTSLFADNWHSDWSFLPSPPAGTLLYGSVIPPSGGDTLFANLYQAYDALPAPLKKQADELTAIHSARLGYSPQGRFGKNDSGRSMDIRPSEHAMATQTHPLVRTHSETGRKTLFASPAYTVGFDGMPEADSKALLAEFFAHLNKDEFVYRHKWQAGMLTLWDNRCLNHRATGGYEGHRRLLYRITVSEPVSEPVH